MPRPLCCLLLAGLLLGASCSSQNSANSRGAAIATTSAVVVGGVLSPLNKLSGAGQGRRLMYPPVYNLGDDRIAIANWPGWFTDKSEFSPRSQGQSAWVINLKTEPRDHQGVIVLANDNLNRWFLRDHDLATLQPIPYEGPLKGVNTMTGDRVQQGSDHRSITVLLGGASYRFMLSQDPIETLQPVPSR